MNEVTFETNFVNEVANKSWNRFSLNLVLGIGNQVIEPNDQIVLRLDLFWINYGQEFEVS